MPAPSDNAPVSPSPTTPSARSSNGLKRSWRRYSLRALFVIVLAAGIFFGWVAYRVRQFHEQAAFIADLRSRGFKIVTEEVNRDWFWRPLASDDAVQVKWADLSAPAANSNRPRGATMEDLKRISSWTSIESLQLYGANVTDETMAVVGTFRDLKRLNLPETAITGAGLRHLEPLKELTDLGISCYFQDQFRGRDSLNEGLLRHIGCLSALNSISLYGIPIPENVLREISIRCPELISLRLQKCRINDAGLQHLKRLTKLSELTLNGNPLISDRGLNSLCGVTSLQNVIVRDTNVSTEGVKRFQKRRPSVRLVHDCVEGFDFGRAND